MSTMLTNVDNVAVNGRIENSSYIPTPAAGYLYMYMYGFIVLSFEFFGGGYQFDRSTD